MATESRGAQKGPDDSHGGLRVSHETRYDYDTPVVQAHHAAHLQPVHDSHQHLEAFDLEVDPAPASQTRAADAFGNVRHTFEISSAHRRLRVLASSRVSVRERFAGLQPALSPAWEAVVARLRYVARGRFEPAVDFAQPSPFVPRLVSLRDWAAPSLAPGRPLALAGLELMRRLHGQWAYRPRSTGVDTPLATAFAQRSGVCQDFAHLLIGGLRAHGLAARYVSGYLLTAAATGGPPVVGADASHAWVQVWCPDTPGVPPDGWLDLDPTNDRVPGAGHVRVAVGRDFGDVTPLRGVILGGGRHALTVAVTTRQAPVGGAA